MEEEVHDIDPDQSLNVADEMPPQGAPIDGTRIIPWSIPSAKNNLCYYKI